MHCKEVRVAELKAITLDLWGTIFHPKDAEEKVERRRAMILEALLEAGLEVDVPRLRGAYRAAHKIIEENVAKEFKDLGPPGRWALLTQQLGLPLDAVPYSRIAAAYEDLTLDYLPPLMEGVEAAIERLHTRYRLGLICNTGYTGGKILREVLKKYGLAHYFGILVFSNEFGWLKPDPRIFHHTLDALASAPAEGAHVGDMEELDVDGAIAAGMLAVRYLPEGPVETKADVVFHHWDEFEEKLEAGRAANARSTA
jgi:putative hydrolase of the HAD superfamily